MNLLNLFSPKRQEDLANHTLDAVSAKERADLGRDFHREYVRNGPVTPRILGARDEKRHNKLSARRDAKKARRSAVSTYFAQRSEASKLHGALQKVGAIPYADGPRARQPHITNQFILDNYGSLEAAKKRYSDLTGAVFV